VSIRKWKLHELGNNRRKKLYLHKTRWSLIIKKKHLWNHSREYPFLYKMKTCLEVM
jgi:hypothetical protein